MCKSELYWTILVAAQVLKNNINVNGNVLSTHLFSIHFLYPLKTTENLTVFLRIENKWVYEGYLGFSQIKISKKSHRSLWSWSDSPIKHNFSGRTTIIYKIYEKRFILPNSFEGKSQHWSKVKKG